MGELYEMGYMTWAIWVGYMGGLYERVGYWENELWEDES